MQDNQQTVEITQFLDEGNTTFYDYHTLRMLRQPPLQSKLIHPPHPLTSNCFLLPPLHGKTGGGAGPEGGSIPLHIGALVVVRSVPPTQEYSSQRAIFSSSVPGHSSLPKN